MMRLPIIIEKNRDNIRVIAALNDMYSRPERYVFEQSRAGQVEFVFQISEKIV